MKKKENKEYVTKVKTIDNKEVVVLSFFEAKSTEDFINNRLSAQEFKIIKGFVHINHDKLVQDTQLLPNRMAKHLPANTPNSTARSLLIYKKPHYQIGVVIELKQKLAHGKVADLMAINLDEARKIEKLLMVSPKANRKVKYCLDLSTQKILVESINDKPTDELALLLSVSSPYIDTPICYTHYHRKAGDPVTIIVSPFHQFGNPSVELVSSLSLLEKHKIAGAWLLSVRALHKNGWCHNDISYANWVLGENLSFRLIDFERASISRR